jgi:hypothetical protein
MGTEPLGFPHGTCGPIDLQALQTKGQLASAAK